MTEYIDADKLIVEGWHLERTRPGGPGEMVFESKSPADFPVADVRPVVRSKWEQFEVTEITEINMPHAVVSMYCPNCKRYHNQVYFYGNPIENVNFCPYCGADMREG